MPDYRNKVLIISVQKEAIAATYEKSEDPIEQDSLSHQSIISQELIPEPTIKMTTRPFIIELYSRVDWWLMNHATSKTELARAEKHFKEEYITLIKSGYQEPVETTHERLETEAVTRYV